MKTEVEFLHHHGSHVPGDVVPVDEEEASKLIRTGRAKLAPAAKAKPAKKAASKRRAAPALRDASSSTSAATDASPVDEK